MQMPRDLSASREFSLTFSRVIFASKERCVVNPRASGYRCNRESRGRERERERREEMEEGLSLVK